MRVLTAVDLGSEPESVLSASAEWASRLGATLDVAYVDEAPAAADYVADPSIRALVEEEQRKLRARRADRLRALVEGLDEGIRGAPRYVEGRAADALIELSSEYDALVVATHGRKGLAHLWLGSVAERLVRLAGVPVIVLRLPAA